jgi:hypothetical protein
LTVRRPSVLLQSELLGYRAHGPRAGIVPEVHLANLKVLDARGAGHVCDVIGAPDWEVDHRAASDIRVIDLSVGASVAEFRPTNPLTMARRALDAHRRRAEGVS